MKVLRVGDPHAKVNNLKEMDSLVGFVIEVAGTEAVDRIEILGDLFHTHAVLRLEVIDFWTKALANLAKVCETIVIEGNHDQSGDYSADFSALSVFNLMKIPNLIIIDKPTQLGIYGYAPYTHNIDSFISSANRLADQGAKVLICHQTIEGSKYESGIYAPDGIPAGQWSERFVHVISGHIHSEQSFGNIIYPGTARWDTAVDANRRKGIWLYEHEADGRISQVKHISTEKVCSPIKFIEYREGDQLDGWPVNARVAVQIIGSSTWVSQEKKKLLGKCSISVKITDRQETQNRQAGNSLEHFISNLFVSTMNKDHLLKYAKEIGIV